MFMFKKSLTMPGPGEALPGRADADPHRQDPFRQRPPAQGAVSGRRSRWRCSGLAVSGAPSANSGSLATASSSRRSAMPAARRRTRPTRKSARGAPATTRWCWWSTIRRRSPTSSCSRRSGKTTTRRRACARATTSARNTAPASTCSTPRSARPPRRRKAMYEKALAAKRYGPITTEIIDAPVLFRRGLSPAISRQEPDGLLRARRHRRVLPDRHGRRRALSGLLRDKA